MWPIEGTNLRAPIELAALPIYSRDRVFMGFRGFGVARMGDVAVDPKAVGMTFAEAQGSQTEKTPEVTDGRAVPAASTDEADAFNGEKPAIAITPRTPERPAEHLEGIEGNVIPLKTQRPLRDDGRLNDAERNAFREIAERLRREVLSDSPRTGREAPRRNRPCMKHSSLSRRSRTPRPFRTLRSVGPGFEPQHAAEATDGSTAATAVEVPAGDFAENIRTQARQGVDTSILAALPLPVLIHRHGEILYANPGCWRQYDTTVLARSMRPAA